MFHLSWHQNFRTKRFFKKAIENIGIFLLIEILGISSVTAQNKALPTVFPYESGYWEESILSLMTLDEKIAQLFMVAVYSSPNNVGAVNISKVEKLIQKYKIGGVIFMQGNPRSQTIVAKKLQEISPVPLLITGDYEWGLNMRLDSSLIFPSNITLGAVNNNELIHKLGMEMANHCRAVGVHVNFAPVVDVNNNKNNPVIGFRSFGDDKFVVAQRGMALSKGLQDGGVMACAKHFPGHGDTDIDSHADMPGLKFSRKRLDSLEIYPFSRLIDNGVHSVMVAHLYVPGIDPTKNTPATLSNKIVTQTLRDSLGFKGIIFTDALNMGGVTKYFPPGEIEVKALEAGNDILLFNDNVPLGIEAIKKAIKSGRLSESDIDKKVKKILTAKLWLSVDRPVNEDPALTPKIIFSDEAISLQEQLYREAITLVKNSDDMLPMKNWSNKKMVCIQIGKILPTVWAQTLQKYGNIDVLSVSKEISPVEADQLISNLSNKYTTVFIGIFDMSKHSFKKFGLTSNTIDFIKKLSNTKLETNLTIFGSPYTVENFEKETSIILAYEEDKASQTAAAEVIFGAYPPLGTLPIKLSPKFQEKPRYIFQKDCLSFVKPETAGVSSESLKRVDEIVDYYIKEKALPGCVVLAAKGNQIFLSKGYGKLDYSGSTSIDPFKTVYDLASVTKVMATTLGTMKLYEEKKLDLNQNISYYLPEATGKVGNIKIIQLLQHMSGLPAFIPFYEKTIKRKKHDPNVYSNIKTDTFSIPLGPNLFLNNNYPGHIWNEILNLKPKEDPKYVYSDINMVILGKIIERLTRTGLDTFLTEIFYKPMNLTHTLFKPFEKVNSSTNSTNPFFVIPPTEEDKHFRMGKVEGFVNDECSAMLGGVAGHAGLFSNAFDLAKILFMLKNGGKYGGFQYLKNETIEYFTQKSIPTSRRGLGWDKPETNPEYHNILPDNASERTYGHLGFTGTCVWVDPEKDMIYIFLSNRTYPDRDNQLFSRARVRGKIMEALYKAIDDYEVKNYFPCTSK